MSILGKTLAVASVLTATATQAYAASLGDPPIECDLATENNKRLFYTGILFMGGASIGLISALVNIIPTILNTYNTCKAHHRNNELTRQSGFQHVREASDSADPQVSIEMAHQGDTLGFPYKQDEHSPLY